MIAQGFRPAAYSDISKTKKINQKNCLDCNAIIDAKGGRKRCPTCSDIRFDAAKEKYKKQWKINNK